MTEFVLQPYVGAIPVTFEMSPADVQQLLGSPARIETNGLGEREEEWHDEKDWRDSVTVRYSKIDGKVEEIAFLPAAKLIYQGHDLFRDEGVIDFLSQYDIPYEIVGFVVFLELGITVTGFHDNDESQKAIVVCRKGRFDAFRDELTPLKR